MLLIEFNAKVLNKNKTTTKINIWMNDLIKYTVCG